ncbi:MAG: hypothetical protein WB816_07470 [Methylocystis sp.]
MKHVTVKSASLAAGACLSAYALLGVSLAHAGITPGPAPLVGVVGGPVGLAAAGVALGGYLLVKHFRDRR